MFTRSSSELEYFHTDEPEPHLARTKAILKDHPEIKKYLGKKNPWTFLVLLISVSLQFGLAWVMSNQPWYILVFVAYFVGTLINQTFIAIIHDASHNLLFKSKTANTLAGILVNLPMFVPSFVSFRKYHMKHHAFQGVYELDADLPERWEAKIVHNRWYMKILWLALYPLWQSIRPSRVREVGFMDMWTAINIVAVFAVNFAVYFLMGPMALLYLFISFWAGFGLSITGARLIQEHFVLTEGQETYSYYGPINFTALNIAYHNEHHDFPSVPWNVLPKIKKIAPEYYDNLASYKSWTGLLLRFLFDKKISVWDRLERKERGGVALNAPINPDLVAANQN